MTTRTLASVRSYYFREHLADWGNHDRWTISDFRAVWKVADRKAREWRRAANNRFNHETQQWEQH